MKPTPIASASSIAGHDGIARGEGFGSREHQAVGDDQRQEDPESGMDRRQPGGECELDGRDRRCNYHHEHRDAHLGQQPTPDQGCERVADQEHGDRGEPQPQAVGDRRADREQGTEPEQLYQAGVLHAEPVGDD